MTTHVAGIEVVKAAAHEAASDFWDVLVKDRDPDHEIDKSDIADAVEHVLAVVLPEIERQTEHRMARLRSVLTDCIDSLEYVDRAHPGVSGWGTRGARIEAAKQAMGMEASK